MTVNLETQSARVVLKPAERLDPKGLREAVKKADFKAGAITVTIKGQVAVNPDKDTSAFADLVLKVSDSGQVILLIPPSPTMSDAKKQAPVKMDRLPGLREEFGTNKTEFVITGEVHAHKEFSIALTVEEFKVVSEHDN